MSSPQNPAASRRFPGWLVPLILALVVLAGWAALPHTDPHKTTDIALIFEQALRIENTIRPPETPPNTPVLVSGKITYRNLAFDQAGITQGSFLAVRRLVEFYAWTEEEVPEEELPPNPERTDRYRYRIEWQSNPRPWREFHVWKGHIHNLPEATGNEETYAAGVAIGRLLIPLADATLLGWEPFVLDEARYPFVAHRIHDGKYFYASPEGRDTPDPGEVRVSFEVIELPRRGESRIITVLGSRDFNRIVPFTKANGRPLMLVNLGDENAMREKIGPSPVPLGLVRLLDVALPVFAALMILLSAALWLRGRRAGAKNA